MGEGIVPAILRRGGQHDPVSGVITWDRFLSFMELAFKYWSYKKVGIFPPLMLIALAFWKRNNLVVMNEDEYLNMRVVRLDLPGGWELKTQN